MNELSHMNYAQLRAFTAVLQEGSFDKAAAKLSLTQSAISQRVKSLEEQFGKLLIIRENPCRPTNEGAILYRHAQQVNLLETDLNSAFHFNQSETKTLPVAVNVDSIATWFLQVMKPFTKATGHYLDIIADDEHHTINLLTEGKVLGAVTTSSKPVQGCQILELGVMKYYAASSTEFVRHHFADGLTYQSFQKAPMILFNHKDVVQHKFMKQALGERKIPEPPRYYIPLPQGFIDAALEGLGWGMFPLPLIQRQIENGQMSTLSNTITLDEPLYWQSWRLETPTLNMLTKCIQDGARKSLLSSN